MGLFSKSDEEKQQEELEKNEEEKIKIKQILESMGMDFESYSDEEIKVKNHKDLRFVKATKAVDTMNELITTLRFDSFQNASLGRLTTLVYLKLVAIRQNELILRQLEKISKALTHSHNDNK